MNEYILLEILKHNEYMLDNEIKLKEIHKNNVVLTQAEFNKLKQKTLNLFEKVLIDNNKLIIENRRLKEELKATRKGLNKVLSKRKKWKDRYYKEKRKNKEIEQQLEQKNKVIKKAIFKTKCIKEYGFDRIAKYKILETLNEGSGK